MQKWYHIFSKNTGLGLYTWIMFCILPFYFVFRLSSPVEVAIGLAMITLFFAAYRLAFIKKGWVVHVSLSIAMAISAGMTVYFGYVYFSLFIAFFIGNHKSKAAFISLYVIHLVTTVAAVGGGFFIQDQILLMQLPFIIVTVIGVIVLPLTLYHRNKRKELEEELQHANERIARLQVVEERQRIARDLHDTLGQKLSLIGMKSDLSRKLVEIEPDRAKDELSDINQTARTALSELREIVSTMKSIKLKDEMLHVQQLLEAAQINFTLDGDPILKDTPALSEHVLSMCVKETVTNIVKHSNAKDCLISIMQSPNEIVIRVKDDGVGIPGGIDHALIKGNGLRGMRERLDFVNGKMNVESAERGTDVTIQVPKVLVQSKEEARLS